MPEASRRRRRIFSIVAWSALVFNLAVVAGGTIVRATGSGDGCGQTWPKCGDQFIPPNATVETLIEFSHRASSFAAGIGIAALFVLSFWAFSKGSIVRKAAMASLILLVIEALLGASLVLFSWVDADISVGRMIAVPLHLTNTFFLLGALALTAWWSSGNPEPANERSRDSMRWLLIGAVTLLVVGGTGALNAIADAVFPSESVVAGISAEFGPTAPALLRLRIVHPVLAVSGGMFVGWVATRFSLSKSATTRRLAGAVVLIVLSQVFIGLGNVFLLTPIGMQVLHLMVADALWILFVLLGASALSERVPARDEVHAS
jgi:heme A synthase